MLWWAAITAGTTSTRTPRPTRIRSASRGFWYSHLGWILRREWEETDESLVPDLTKYPELRALEPPGAEHAAGGRAGRGLPGAWAALHALVWGYFVSTVLLWHGSFSINSLSHLFGKRRYATDG